MKLARNLTRPRSHDADNSFKEKTLQEITKYKNLVLSLLHFADKIESDFKFLSGIHDNLSVELISFVSVLNCGMKVEERDRIDKFLNAMVQLSSSFREIKLQKLRDRLRRCERGLDMLLAAMKVRDAAFSEKSHYATKIDALESNSSTATSEKLQRNRDKYVKAENEFTRINRKVSNECQSALDSRFIEIDEIIDIFVTSIRQTFEPLHFAFKAVADVPQIASRFVHATSLTAPILDDEFKF